jgi:uncharacterized protein (DUF1330 family)
MAVYFISEVTEILDPERHTEYVECVRPIAERYGGRYPVRGEDVEPVSGDWRPVRLIVLEPPDRKAVQDCLASEAYQAIAPLRESSVKGGAVLAQEVEET